VKWHDLEMATQVMYGMLFGIYTTTTNLLDSCVLGVSAGTQEQCVNHMNLTSDLHEHLDFQLVSTKFQNHMAASFGRFCPCAFLSLTMTVMFWYKMTWPVEGLYVTKFEFSAISEHLNRLLRLTRHT